MAGAFLPLSNESPGSPVIWKGGNEEVMGRVARCQTLIHDITKLPPRSAKGATGIELSLLYIESEGAEARQAICAPRLSLRDHFYPHEDKFSGNLNSSHRKVVHRRQEGPRPTGEGAPPWRRGVRPWQEHWCPASSTSEFPASACLPHF